MIDAVLRPAPIVLIVPPFHWTTRPALGVHLLQAIARRTGVEVQVIYANLLFASQFGVGTYETLSTLQYTTFIGERMFVRAAYDLPRLGRDRGANLARRLDHMRRVYEEADTPFSLDVPTFEHLEARVARWVDEVALSLAGGPAVVGCSSSFEQNAASIAILRAIKQHAPGTTTILGGANCEGPMARGLIALTDAVDYVFSGESEQTFAEFVAHVRAGTRPTTRIFDGLPCEALDELPTPDYTDYYAQLQMWLPRQAEAAVLPYETSRGCWWGEKKHCTFCGLNGQGMASRVKSPQRALSELGVLLDKHPNRKISMTDNIMPYTYWKTFVPRLRDELPGAEIMYEQKANLSLDQVAALARAGIREIQPGIESLSSGLLKLMDKGTTGPQNVALLRYTAAFGMKVHWLLLCGFPGDQRAFYEETLALMPLIHHLPPPKVVTPIVLDRFSPYHTFPERYGVRELRPLDGYLDVLPEHADPQLVSYHFTGTFESESLADPELMPAMHRELTRWRNAYFRSRPRLEVVGELDGDLELIDTRGLPGTTAHSRISREQALAALVTRKATATPDGEAHWALAMRVAVIRDGRYVALATARPELFAQALATSRQIPLPVVA